MFITENLLRQRPDPGRRPDPSPAPAAATVDPDDVERLAWGYGIPPEPTLTEVRRIFWHLRRLGVALPVERRVILIAGG